MINPQFIKLLDANDVLDVLKDSVTCQLQKICGVEKTSEDKEWHSEIPQIAREKFDNYKTDYEHLSRIFKLEQEEINNEMSKGHYYWRLLCSACNTYRNDLTGYDHHLNQEFNLKEADAISDNEILNECVGVLDQRVI